MGYDIRIHITWPHSRCLLGWSYLQPDDEENYHTFELFFTIISIQFNWD
jgi:hypothetical protein